MRVDIYMNELAEFGDVDECRDMIEGLRFVGILQERDFHHYSLSVDESDLDFLCHIVEKHNSRLGYNLCRIGETDGK